MHHMAIYLHQLTWLGKLVQFLPFKKDHLMHAKICTRPVYASQKLEPPMDQSSVPTHYEKLANYNHAQGRMRFSLGYFCNLSTLS